MRNTMFATAALIAMTGAAFAQTTPPSSSTMRSMTPQGQLGAGNSTYDAANHNTLATAPGAMAPGGQGKSPVGTNSEGGDSGAGGASGSGGSTK